MNFLSVEINCRQLELKLSSDIVTYVSRSVQSKRLTNVATVNISVHSRVGRYNCNSVLHSLLWSRLQLLQSVLNSVAPLIRGLGQFDHITLVLIDLHWLPYPQRISYKICLLMFKRLKGLAPAYLSDRYLCWRCGCSGSFWFEIQVRGDLVVPGHRTEWGSRSSAVAGPKCWNKLPVGLRDLLVGSATFARHLRAGFSD